MMLVSTFLAAALAQQVPTSEFLETRQLTPTDDESKDTKEATEEPATTTTTTTPLATTANGSHVLEGEKFDCLIEAAKGGKAVAMVDFDKTLSRHTNPDGKKGKTSHNIIILPDATQEAKDADFEKYHAIEIDPDMTVKEKIPIMEEWYGRTNTHIINSGITEEKMIKDVEESPVLLRDGVVEFFQECARLNIPVIVVSAGLGDVASLVLKRFFREKNIPESGWSMVSNNLQWSDEKPKKIIGVSEPLIHMFNKSWAGVSEEIKDKHKLNEKTNVMVVGDSNGDSTIAHGSPYGQVTIGFLNDNLVKKTPQYNCLFDYLLLGGGSDGESFQPITDVLKKVRDGAEEDATLLEKPVCKAPKAYPAWNDTERTCGTKNGTSNLSLAPLLLLSVFFLL